MNTKESLRTYGEALINIAEHLDDNSPGTNETALYAIVDALRTIHGDMYRQFIAEAVARYNAEAVAA